MLKFFFMANYGAGYFRPAGFTPTTPSLADPVQEVRADYIFESIGLCVARIFFGSNPWT